MIEEEMMEKGFTYLSGIERFAEIKKEVPFLSRCIDVVILDENNLIISIEFKVKKWRQAIEQATNHKLGADKAYICLPKRELSVPLREALEKRGIGLLLFDPNGEEVITEAFPPASTSTNVFAFREMLVANFKKVS